MYKEAAVRMKPRSKQTAWAIEESRGWVGAEGTVGPDARRYLRQREGSGRHRTGLIVGVSFVVGLTLGWAVGWLCRSKIRQKEKYRRRLVL